MDVAWNVLLLVVGFVLLVQSAKVFVNASVDIARRLRIPTMVIGLTVVAMGTSAPEVVISVSAAMGGSGDLAVANVIGSNFFNLIFIVGLCAVLYPISVKTKVISRDYWVNVAATLALLLMVIVFNDVIPRIGGLILLVGFAVYMILLVRHTLKNRTPECDIDETEAPPKPLWRSIIFAVLGAAVIMGGGMLTVDSAINIATAMGVTERVIGLTIVAMGTSLPELVTTIIACKKGEGEFALGFILGSSIFNLMLVLGLAGIITPLTIESSVLFDISVLTAATLLFYLFVKTGQKISRMEGFALVAIFLGYMAFVIAA
ncbi:MAG: calcium/sodium antiporter [Defluviitaleaceae bacterium]|nr:calcium/sodium antiporter [Defluviitaleaceae bacterium]